MLPIARLEKIHELWDGLRNFPPAKSDAALAHLFERLSALIDADNAMWFGVVRTARGAAARSDWCHGWRCPVVHPWKRDPRLENLIQRFLQSLDAPCSVGIGAATVQMMAEAGHFRAHRLRDGWIDYAAFRRTLHYQVYYTKAGIADRLWIGVPVNEDTESIFAFDRVGRRRRRFTPDEVTLAAQALRGLKWFHRQTLLRHGVLAAKTRLTPTERRVVPLLLSDRIEKEIAAELGLTFAATHQHARSVYAKFAVRSRAGLMALWLGP